MGKRVILFTGKGGVGKTTIAAATAIKLSEEGYKTLVISVDPAHSLQDALDVKLGPEPIKVNSNLYAQEVDVYYSIKKYWAVLRDYIVSIFKWQKVDEILAEEIAVFPGMEEGAAFLWIEKFYREDDFDTIIIDSAPSGETLKLLALPQVIEWWVEKLFPVQRKVARTIKPFLEKVTDFPLPSDETYNAVEDIYNKLTRVYEILTDPSVTTIRLVLNPEKMVIMETKHTFSYLTLFGYPIDLVIVNRLIPEKFRFAFFEDYLLKQREYLKEIENDFSPIPILYVSHQGKEVFGLSNLKLLADELYQDRNPRDIFHSSKPYEVFNENGRWIMQVRVLGFDKKDVEIFQIGDELVIQMKNQRKSIYLPKFLKFYTIAEATLRDGFLRICFSKKD